MSRRGIALAEPPFYDFALRRDENPLPFHCPGALTILRHQVGVLVENPDYIRRPLELERREHRLVIWHVLPHYNGRADRVSFKNGLVLARGAVYTL